MITETLEMGILNLPVYSQGLEKKMKKGNLALETTAMYDAPTHPKISIDEDGNVIRTKDKSQKRTSLITDEVRVYKGGSWKDRAYWLDPAQRRYLPQYIATDYIGFRCAMTRLGSKGKTKKNCPTQT